MPAQQTDWTAEMARALPDDGMRYEVLDGTLVVSPSPSWRHQTILKRLFELVNPYVEAHALGWTRWSPADIEFGPKILLQPDLFVVPDTGQGEPESWKDVTSLLLVAEVLSPSTMHIDRGDKRIIFMRRRVPEYWILDGDRRIVERWRPGETEPEVLNTLLEWQPRPDLAPLRIDIALLLR